MWRSSSVAPLRHGTAVVLPTTSRWPRLLASLALTVAAAAASAAAGAALMFVALHGDAAAATLHGPQAAGLETTPFRDPP